MCFLVVGHSGLPGCARSLFFCMPTRGLPSLCVSHRLTGYGIHHCFARSMMGHEVKVPLLENFYADYYTMASIALASCLAMCVVVRFLGRRGGLLLFMILTALASLLQLGLLNREWGWGSGTAVGQGQVEGAGVRQRVFEGAGGDWRTVFSDLVFPNQQLGDMVWEGLLGLKCAW